MSIPLLVLATCVTFIAASFVFRWRRGSVNDMAVGLWRDPATEARLALGFGIVVALGIVSALIAGSWLPLIPVAVFAAIVGFYAVLGYGQTHRR